MIIPIFLRTELVNSVNEVLPTTQSCQTSLLNSKPAFDL